VPHICCSTTQLVGDPDLGFTGLRQFGTSLINHVTMKVRPDLAVSNIMIVDSPGMIDSPINSGIGQSKSASDFVGTMSSPRDRGYNFPGVVRWFAERADVILLFFDPDKPVRLDTDSPPLPSYPLPYSCWKQKH
jgi:hypothetical protein